MRNAPDSKKLNCLTPLTCLLEKNSVSSDIHNYLGLKTMDQSQPGVESDDGGTESFEWQKLCLDTEEICKARFRRLLENSSELKGKDFPFQQVDVTRNVYQTN
jgi:hypothetical protein